MKLRKFLFITVISLLGTAFLAGGLSRADSTSSNSIGVADGFKVSPVRYEETVDKGTTKTFIIYVTGVNKYPIIAQAIINDFDASNDESGNPSLILDASQPIPADNFKSIVSSIANTEIQPGQTAQIPVVIKVPANAQPGGYYGIVRFASAVSLNPSSSQTNVSLSASTGTLFLITVPGNLTEKLAIISFSAAKNGSMGRIYTTGKNLQIITRIQNTGNIHSAPFGKIEISHSGKIISEIKFNNTVPPGQILPNSVRKFTYSVTDQSGFGKYNINTYLGYGTQGNLLIANNVFWIIPWWLIGLVVVAATAVICAGYLIYRKIKESRRRHKRHIRSAHSS